MKSKLKVNSNPFTIGLFGRLKDHKNNYPLKRIVTKCAGPTYFLGKAFVALTLTK